MAYSLTQKELVKSEFAHLDSTYFNTAYFGPSPYRAKQKVSRALQKELDPSFYDYNTWMGISERLRGMIATFLGRLVDTIAHSASSSDTINNIVHGYEFAQGDVVAAINTDYPSNVLPWMVCQKLNPQMKFELLDLKGEIVPTAQWLAKNLPANTKIFSISHVTFDTGKRIDLLEIGRLMRERNILFVVDATQSLGGLAISQDELDTIDVLTCSSYKWMLGPYGHAFAYYSPLAQQKIRQNCGNWIISPNSKIVHNLVNYTTETLPGARMYDRGQASNMLAMACLEASLEFFQELGANTIEQHNKIVRDYFLANYPKKKYELLTPLDHMGNIVALKALHKDPLKLERELKFRNIDISVRQWNLRLSFHLFNTVEQVDQLLSALDIET